MSRNTRATVLALYIVIFVKLSLITTEVKASQLAYLPLPVYARETSTEVTRDTIMTVGGTAILPEYGAQSLQDLSESAKHPNGAGQISVYVVHKGDTLGDIAELFSVSKSSIMIANDIDQNEIIHVGDRLVILEGEEVITSLKPTKKIVKKLPVYTGYYTDPLPEHIRTQGLHGHNGVDLASNCHCEGADIFAAAAGEVIVSKDAGYNGGYGKYVVISHSNGTQTVYGHLAQAIVNEGETVEQGDVIGILGDTGHSTGPHLHFEVRGAKNPF